MSILFQYESCLRKNEQKIRILYSDIFNLKVKNTFLENNIDILLKKEKEYRLVKEKTGVIVENGTIVYNDRKENEIFILRTENSNLKNVIIKNEKELNDLREKNSNEKIIHEKQINNLNHKINLLKYKLRQKNQKTKVKSISNLNINNNNKTEKLRLNFSINNNSLNKDNKELNNNDLNNVANSKKIIEIKNDKKYKGNQINLDEKKTLIHCQSTGHLNLKNKIINKLKKIKHNENSNVFQAGLNLSNVNKSATQKKLLCLTPHNNNDSNNSNNQTFNKNSEYNKHNLIISKKCHIIKNSTSNQNININNNFNEIKIIYKNNPKNNNNVNKTNNTHKKIKNELACSQNNLMNNSCLPNNSAFKIKNINYKNKIMKRTINANNITTTNCSKNNGYSGINIKRQRNARNNVIEKNNSISNKFSLTSIRRKNTTNSYIKNSKTNLNHSKNSN